jgi:hypothetical protein
LPTRFVCFKCSVYFDYGPYYEWRPNDEQRSN